jgi:hypothetical protein
MTAHSDRTIRCTLPVRGRGRGIPKSQVQIDAGLILEAAARAVTFWLDDPLLLRGLLTRPEPAISDGMMVCSSDDQPMGQGSGVL